MKESPSDEQQLNVKEKQRLAKHRQREAAKAQLYPMSN
jgi:hypothetical protein